MADRVPPNNRMNWNTLSKNLVFWLLIILMPIAVYRMLGTGGQEHAEITYTRFRSQLELDNIAEIEITSGKFIEGDFKRGVVIDGRAIEHFRVVLPIQDSEVLLSRLEEQNVLIRGREPKPSFGASMISEFGSRVH